MKRTDREWRQRSMRWVGVSMVALILAGGCNVDSTMTGTTDDDNVLLSDTLGFEGSLSGKVSGTQSTRSSLTDESTGQSVPPEFDTANTCVRFRDLAGNDLVGANGEVIAEVPMNPDGTFEADNLPVGVDFTYCADIGKNGICDIESCTNIPSDDGGRKGALTDVEADPLTTLVLAKLKSLLEEKGVDLSELPISPVAVVTRIVDAYEHLFEESGIDQNLSLDDIGNVAAERLAALFDTLVPSGARTGMDLVDGNLELAREQDRNGKALSIAKVFLRAGFPILDGPGDPDLSALGELDGVTTLIAGEFFQLGDKFTEDFEDFNPELDEFLEPAQFGFPEDEFVYFIEQVEPDRNFANAEGEFEQKEGGPPPLPVLNDYLLVQMARLQSENRRVSLASLYELLTSLENGLGVRLTYFLFDPNFHGPPLDVFETADGEGKAINLEGFFRRLFADGFQDIDPESFDARDAELRQLMKDLLAETIPPTIERLFAAILRERVGSVEELSDAIRNARAHLPFSRSGPSEFFVVADGDVFRGDADAQAVTVDADVTLDGDVLALSFNETGDGAYWLGFTPRTEEDGTVELIVRETGRFLNGPRGPVRVNLNNEEFFAPIDGVPFIDVVSETGRFYPGVPLTVIRDDFVPEPFRFEDEFNGPFDGEFVDPFDPLDDPFVPDDEIIVIEDPLDETPVDEVIDETVDTTEVPVEETPAQALPFDDGPNEQIFVLATDVGPDAEPVRIDFDRTTGTATYNPAGRHVLLFLPDSDQTGLFAVFNEQTGRPARFEDPDEFFSGPVERPDRFEDFFNNFQAMDEFMGFDEFDDLGLFVDGFVDGIPEDEFFFPPDEVLPDDGSFVDDEFFFPEDEVVVIEDEILPPSDETTPVDETDTVTPAQVDEEVPVDGEVVTDEEIIDEVIDFEPPPVGFGDEFEIIISVDDIDGIPLAIEEFAHVFGTDVPNQSYDPAGDPFFDDINGNGEQDADEPTAQFRPLLFDPNDWRATDLRLYYRRADNNAAVTFDEIDFESPTPQTLDGVALVARNYLPRLNAFRFSRPNTAINLLTAFLPPEFFNGTTSLNRDTKVDILSAIAMINLVMDQIFNVEAVIDVDGLGPLPPQPLLTDAHLFVVPIGDPFVLLLKGFDTLSEPEAPAP